LLLSLGFLHLCFTR